MCRPPATAAATVGHGKKAHRGGKGQGSYEALTNNCINYCSRGIEAGGGEGPPTGRAAVPWIRMNFDTGGGRQG